MALGHHLPPLDDETPRPLDQVQDMGRTVTAESENRSDHCSRPVLPNPVSPQKPKVVSLGAMTANSINNDGTGEINILPTRGVRESPPSNVANTVENI